MSDPILSRRELLFGRSNVRDARSDLLEDEGGASAVEYGLIAAVLALALIPAMTRMGRRTRRPLNCTRRTMNRARRGRALPGCAQ